MRPYRYLSGKRETWRRGSSVHAASASSGAGLLDFREGIDDARLDDDRGGDHRSDDRVGDDRDGCAAQVEGGPVRAEVTGRRGNDVAVVAVAIVAICEAGGVAIRIPVAVIAVAVRRDVAEAVVVADRAAVRSVGVDGGRAGRADARAARDGEHEETHPDQCEANLV